MSNPSPLAQGAASRPSLVDVIQKATARWNDGDDEPDYPDVILAAIRDALASEDGERFAVELGLTDWRRGNGILLRLPERAVRSEAPANDREQGTNE